MVFHIKAILGKLIICSMDMEAPDKYEFPSAGKN